MDTNALYRSIPKVDELQRDKSICQLSEDGIAKQFISQAISDVLDEAREKIRIAAETNTSGETPEEHEKIKQVSSYLEYEGIIKRISDKARLMNSDRLRRVINAAGVVIHTNMGRSLIDEDMAIKALQSASKYNNLELNLDTGKRGSRYDLLEDLICKVTGAEAAHVVNNNAAAVILVLSELAKGSEVPVSRGELVEIGGSFRVPDIMRISGCDLREVGTTNKTKISDYAAAVSENTKLLLKVHRSNYKIMGFTEEASLEQLSELASKNDLILYYDIGSGSLVDLEGIGAFGEPTVQAAIRAGADVVSFSGDKLLGGPQAGIICGKADLIRRMKKNQLTRALRLDKIIISLLEQTFKAYLDDESVFEKIPTLRMLSADYQTLCDRAKELIEIFDSIEDGRGRLFEVELIDGFSEVGGGSLPMTRLKTKLVSVKPVFFSETEFLRGLREFSIPIIARAQGERVLFDPRCILEDEYAIIESALLEIIKEY